MPAVTVYHRTIGHANAAVALLNLALFAQFGEGSFLFFAFANTVFALASFVLADK